MCASSQALCDPAQFYLVNMLKMVGHPLLGEMAGSIAIGLVVGYDAAKKTGLSPNFGAFLYVGLSLIAVCITCVIFAGVYGGFSSVAALILGLGVRYTQVYKLIASEDR